MAELTLQDANALASKLANQTAGLSSFGSEHVHRVSGMDGITSFQTKPNSDYALFEDSSDIFCFKVTDEANNPTYRFFAFKEVSRDEALREISPYLMKGELESFKTDILAALRTEMNSFKEEILNAQQPIREQQESTIVFPTGSARSNS